MPQKGDRMFADLGRPTRRGIRNCPKCQTVNGTRGSLCKNKECDMVFRGKEVRKTGSLDACQLTGLPGYKEKLFSVRVKDRGQEHRTFVQLFAPESTSTIDREALELESDECLSEFKCFLDTCNKSRNKDKSGKNPCLHVQSAQKCNAEAPTLELKPSIRSSLDIPQHHLETLSSYFHGPSQLAVHRVSKTSFAILLKENDSLEMVHTMFIKPSRNEPNVERRFNCSCLSLKEPEDENSCEEIEMCVHYYACICVLASDALLLAEFDQFIPYHAQQPITSPMLGQLHLVSSDGKSVELDHTLSVEILGDNLSLLESMSASDDSSLSNVQTLEGVLSDQIIVTSVDEALTFGDATVLEGLDDSDQQVCHIFSNSQTTIQLSYPHQTPQETVDSHSQDFEVEQPVENITLIEEVPSPPKRRKACTPKTTIDSAPSTFTNNLITAIPQPSDSGFEAWLSGVNEHINCTMHYRLSPKPEPLVYFIPTVYFEHLKERITSVFGTKKRLPNQTVVFHRIDRAPVGTFTKHVWKITNIPHLLHIFHCRYVCLKIKHDFIKSASGNYKDWGPPPAPVSEDEKNQRILPVLHTTYLKCGRNCSSPSPTKESVPFIIEWIPDLFEKTGLGEVSFRFEFSKSEPLVREVPRLRRR